MTMKQLLLLTLFIPSLLWAQEDSKYLAGAVPEEDGKVVFSEQINAPALSKDQIYDIMLDWAQTRFNTKVERVVYTNKEEGEIAVVGQDYLVFQNLALSLDRSLMDYRVIIECKDHLCSIKMNGIRYSYNVSYQRDPEKYTAEKWITDEYALNKNKTKLYRGNGKFRKKTIDFAENLFKEATAALGVQAVSVAPKQEVTAVMPATIASPAPDINKTASKEGYTNFTADKVPSTLVQMLPESKMQVTTDKYQTVKETAATWKGVGNMFGKSVTTISIDPESTVYKNIGNNDLYNISFFKQGEDSAWMIFECRKVGETDENGQKTLMGEVIHVWVK